VADEDQIRELQDRLIASATEMERLKSRALTTLSGTEFMTILMVFPLILSFTILGIIIVWKTTSNPAEVAPHLDLVLVAMGLFSGPVTAFVATLAQRLMTESKAKGDKDD
jgi:phosphoglycerol transferase MdoB-like AlkP superfamily enzyme